MSLNTRKIANNVFFAIFFSIPVAILVAGILYIIDNLKNKKIEIQGY